MPISKLDAIGACKALGEVVKDATLDNAVLHDNSHWSETNARAALATKRTCGYYFKIHEFLQRPGGKSYELNNPPAPPIKRKCSLVVEKLPIDVNDSFILIRAALKIGTAGLAIYKESDNPGRCHVFAPFPPGYGGFTLSRDPSVSGPCTYVVLILEAGATQPASLVTHLPATQAYANLYADLP